MGSLRPPRTLLSPWGAKHAVVRANGKDFLQPMPVDGSWFTWTVRLVLSVSSTLEEDFSFFATRNAVV